MSRNSTQASSTPLAGTSSTSTASRRLTVRFPNSDQAAAAFLQTQTNVSLSLRVLIRQYVETHGARDVLGLVLEQATAATSGGSPAAGSESAGAQPAPPPPRTIKRSATSGQPLPAVRRREASTPVLEDSTQLDMDEIFAMAAVPSSSTGVVTQ